MPVTELTFLSLPGGVWYQDSVFIPPRFDENRETTMSNRRIYGLLPCLLELENTGVDIMPP